MRSLSLRVLRSCSALAPPSPPSVSMPLLCCKKRLVMRAAKNNKNINIVAVNDPFVPTDYMNYSELEHRFGVCVALLTSHTAVISTTTSLCGCMYVICMFTRGSVIFNPPLAEGCFIASLLFIPPTTKPYPILLPRKRRLSYHRHFLRKSGANSSSSSSSDAFRLHFSRPNVDVSEPIWKKRQTQENGEKMAMHEFDVNVAALCLQRFQRRLRIVELSVIELTTAVYK